jgi:hypothetical protein
VNKRSPQSSKVHLVTKEFEESLVGRDSMVLQDLKDPKDMPDMLD